MLFMVFHSFILFVVFHSFMLCMVFHCLMLFMEYYCIYTIRDTCNSLSLRVAMISSNRQYFKLDLPTLALWLLMLYDFSVYYLLVATSTDCQLHTVTERFRQTWSIYISRMETRFFYDSCNGMEIFFWMFQMLNFKPYV